MDHLFLTKMFPISSQFQGDYLLTKRWPTTPFRIVMNAGDPLARQTAPSSMNQLSTKSMRWSTRDGARTGDGASGNQHYVYDHSVYVKYKGLLMKNKQFIYDKGFVA
jgi:hypothetical protein